MPRPSQADLQPTRRATDEVPRLKRGIYVYALAFLAGCGQSGGGPGLGHQDSGAGGSDGASDGSADHPADSSADTVEAGGGMDRGLDATGDVQGDVALDAPSPLDSSDGQLSDGPAATDAGGGDAPGDGAAGGSAGCVRAVFGDHLIGTNGHV